MSGGVFAPARRQRRGGEPCGLTPGGEAGPHDLVALGGWEEVPAGADVVGDRAEGGEDLLGVPRRLEALEHPLSSASWAVGVLRRLLRPVCRRCATPGSTRRAAGASRANVAVSTTRGWYPRPSTTRRRKASAASRLRRGCTRMSSTIPS